VTRTLRSFAVACLAAALLTGCYESHPGTATPVDPTDDGGIPMPPPPPPPPPPPAGDGTFVVSSLRLPAPTGGRAPGMDLDGIDSREGSVDPSATCEEFVPDFTSLHGGEPGVDNAWVELAPTFESLIGASYDELLAERIAAGDLLLGVRLEGADASLVALSPTGPLRLDGDGRPVAGQRFEVVEVLAGGVRSPAGDRERVSLEGPLRLPGVDMFLPLLPIAQLSRAQLEYRVAPVGLLEGELGGVVDVELAVALIASFMPGIEDTVRSILESVADIDPGPEPQICEGLSIGMAFDAVPAELE